MVDKVTESKMLAILQETIDECVDAHEEGDIEESNRLLVRYGGQRDMVEELTGRYVRYDSSDKKVKWIKEEER